MDAQFESQSGDVYFLIDNEGARVEFRAHLGRGPVRELARELLAKLLEEISEQELGGQLARHVVETA